jgi:hypothetical protein
MVSEHNEHAPPGSGEEAASDEAPAADTPEAAQHEHAPAASPRHAVLAWPRLVLDWLRRDALVLLLFALVSLVAMSPVLPVLRTHVLGPPGDNFQHAYLLGWVGQSFLLGESPFIDPRLNYPADLALPATDASFLGMALVAPVTWLLGPPTAYNLLTFLAHMLSGYFAYLWIVRLTGSRAGGLVAGLIFLLAPYRIIRSYGQLNLISTQMLPLFFWALDRALIPPRPREKDLWLLGGATLLLGGFSQYLLVMCLVTGAVYALLLLLPRPGYLLHSGWRLVFSVGVGGLISILPYFSLLSCGIFEPFSVGRTRLWSADPLNFVLPPVVHPLWGSLVEQVRPEEYWGEKTLYLGLVPMLLALVGMATWGRVANRERRWVWLGVILAAVVFALGTDLWLNNQPVQRDDPFWLPAYYLSHLPLLGSMRVWARFGIIAVLFVALLAGVGTAFLVQRAGARRGTYLLVLLVALVVVDFLPPNVGASSPGPRPIDLWLAEQEGDFAVAFLPAEHDVANYQAMYGSLFHAKHLPAFVHSRHMPRTYEAYMYVAVDFPDPDAVQQLRAMDLRYLILEQRLFTGWRTPTWEEVTTALEDSDNLRIVTEVDGFVVLEFAAPEAAARPNIYAQPLWRVDSCAERALAANPAAP